MLYLCLSGEPALVFSEFGLSFRVNHFMYQCYRIIDVIHVLAQLSMKPCSEVNWEIDLVEKIAHFEPCGP